MSDSGIPPGFAAKERHRIAIAVRPALWGEILHLLLEKEQGLEVVGRVETEDALVRTMDSTRPDIALFDYEALGPSAEAVITRLRRGFPLVRVLVLASRSSEEVSVAVLRAGAAGLVAKHSEYSTLVAAIRAVGNGETWANRRTAARALDQLTAPAGYRPAGNSQLTRRERDIVDAVGHGLRNREIARTMGISEKTVKSHLNNIFTKLGVRSRTVLALWGVDHLERKT